MSHEIHTTDALVLSSQPIKEANKFFKILTKDFGLVNATAQNVRSNNSKLRYALQDLSFLKVSLVNGREIWRITNAISGENILIKLSSKEESKEVIFRIINLIKSLVHGEEKESKLFDIIYSAFNFLKRKTFKENGPAAGNSPLAKDVHRAVISTESLDSGWEIKSIENITVLRILQTLGYLENEERFKNFFENNEYSEKLIEEEKENRKEILKTINKTLQQI